MSLKQAATIQASVVWDQEQANAGFEATKQSGSDAHALRPSVTTYQEIFLAAYTVTATSGTQAVDLRSFTNKAGGSVTATKIIGFAIFATATATGGVLKLKPHGTNGLVWPFSDASDELALTVGTDGAKICISQGTAQTIDSTHKQWLLSNTGSADITVKVYAIVGTT